MGTRFDARRILMAVAAPLLSIVVAVVVTSIILFVAGDPVGAVWAQLFKAPLPRQVVAIINATSVYYLSAIAVAARSTASSSSSMSFTESPVRLRSILRSWPSTLPNDTCTASTGFSAGGSSASSSSERRSTIVRTP